MEEENNYAYCAGPHRYPVDKGSPKAQRLVPGPFRVVIRRLNGQIASRCPVCGLTPFESKGEADADKQKGIRLG